MIVPHPHLEAAQHAYMARSGTQISQTEIQRLHWSLSGGATIDDAVATVYEFFATPIDWEAEREALAARPACRRPIPDA